MRAWAALLLLLAGCYDPPRHVLAIWDRVFASGTPVPRGTVDRSTFWYEGEMDRDRDGARAPGSWEEDVYASTLTFKIGGAVEVWRGNNPAFCPDGSTPCLRLRRDDEDDWYRGGY